MSIKGDLADAVSKLKKELDGDLLSFGCGELARNLVARGLVDELRFWVHPAIWSGGQRPFEEQTTLRLELLGSESFDSSVTFLRYKPSVA